MFLSLLNIHDWSFFAVRLAQLDKRRSAEREVAGSTHRPDQHLGGGLLMLSRNCCLRRDICKRLAFLVFSDRGSPQVVRWQNFNELGSRAVIVFLVKNVAKYTLTKTDHCKYLRKESLKNIHAALEVRQMLQGVMRDNICFLPVEQHFNSHQIQTYHQRKVRHKQVLSSIDKKSTWDEHVTSK